MARRKVRVALHHLERLPPAKLLNRPGVHTRHDESARERVAVPVPRVAVEPGRRCTSRPQCVLGRLDGLRKELVGTLSPMVVVTGGVGFLIIALVRQTLGVLDQLRWFRTMAEEVLQDDDETLTRRSIRGLRYHFGIQTERDMDPEARAILRIGRAMSSESRNVPPEKKQ